MTPTTNNPAGNYASINGITLYYEIHGTGKPLIMLHGGFGTFEMFAAGRQHEGSPGSGL
jgi:pimeloyl-ACP methyl ester carboxylesterase